MRYVGGLEIFFHSKVDIKIKFSRFRQQKTFIRTFIKLFTLVRLRLKHYYVFEGRKLAS